MNKIIQFFLNLFRGKSNTDNNKGLIDDPTDFRDFLLEAISKDHIDLPENYEIPYILTKKNQYRKPECVGFSCSLIKDEKERREQNYIDFDGSWIYKRAKEIDNYNGYGTYFRAGLKVLKNTGAMPLKGGDPSIFRIGGYARIKPKFETLKEAIYRYGVVLVGFTMSNEGWKIANVRKPHKGEKTFGHAIACVGFDKDRIKFQNSWGKRWGDKGYGYFTKDYLPMSGWVVLVDLPNDFKDLLKKEKTQYVFNNDLYFGMKNNEEVKILQKILKERGCFPPQINETGNYFAITMKAVKNYQIRKGISQVGRFGPKTRKAMNEELRT